MPQSGQPQVQVVFGCSAAGTVRDALRRIGRTDRVIGLPDDLSYGPINPPSPELRRSWAKTWLGYDFDEDQRRTEPFWAAATSSHTEPTAWVSRRHAGEFAGFLEFVSRMAGRSFRVIDATDVEIPGSQRQPWLRRQHPLSSMLPESILAAGLPERDAVLEAQPLAAYRATWDRLRLENAPLRTIDETGLVSVSFDHYDLTIASCATAGWQNGARVVGAAIFKLFETEYGRPSDLVVWARVCALGATGVLDISGDVSEMRKTLVRLAGS